MQFFNGQPTSPASSACPVTTPPSFYSSVALNTCQATGAGQDGIPTSSIATCANGVTTVTAYSTSSTCTGASTVINYPAGCSVVTQGAFSAVVNSQCAGTQSSGASSAALAAASMLLAALALAAAVAA